MIDAPPTEAEMYAAWDSPAGLASMATGCSSWFPARHLSLINDWLVDLHEGRRRFIAIFAPPRHGKSALISEWFPVWWLGLHRSHEVMLACHTSELAEINGGLARDHMAEIGLRYFDVELKYGGKAPRNGWQIRGHRGRMHAVGVGGTLTGKGADLLIIDDPIKGAAEAFSTTERRTLWKWWTGVAAQRLNPGGRIVLMFTRWHWGDLAGRILDEDTRSDWDVLTLPAIALEDDQLGREPGEALWPEMYPLGELDRIKATVGPHAFHAQYKQDPSPDEGAIFSRDRFRYFFDGGQHFELILQVGDSVEQRKRVLKDDCLWLQTVDFAHRTQRQNDFTVVLTAAITPDRDLIIVDIMRQKLEMARQWPAMRRCRDAFPRVAYMAAEKRGAGYGPFAAAINDGYVLKELKADAEKRVRALPVSVGYEAGRVYHDRAAPWLAEFEDELLTFPAGRHDDMVDCLSYAWLEIGAEAVEACMIDGDDMPDIIEVPSAGRGHQARRSDGSAQVPASGASQVVVNRRQRRRLFGR